MSAALAMDARKRKRTDGNDSTKRNKPRKAPKQAASSDGHDDILALEEQIGTSHDNHDQISTLQQSILDYQRDPDASILSAVALCRAFCRLIARQEFSKRKSTAVVSPGYIQGLRDGLAQYQQSLITWIGDADATKENTALSLLMRIVKEEATNVQKDNDAHWRSPKSIFMILVRALLQEDGAEGARHQFVEKYLEKYDDVRFYTFVAIKQCLLDKGSSRTHVVCNALDMLSLYDVPSNAEPPLNVWLGQEPQGDKNPLSAMKAHRKVAREAWLALFRSEISQEQRKQVLLRSKAQILPWFSGHIELLTDFLTDSFNQGGATSLLALQGIFDLMTQKNLDYPDFYRKLYSLLNDETMHSKHRSRFFRLLGTCMQSTHLPAALLASFMKRLSRLALSAPPGAIVWVVPWVYNMLKQHPACTFMLHRTPHPAHEIYALNPCYEEEGMDDIFDAKQSDPMLTRAIDSSLWELETLQSHYHPNVATLAKIMSEQFTKREYQLEDFLDHSYPTLIDAELGKDIKKAPVVEWEIPKRIITAESADELSPLGSLLQSAFAVL